MIIIPSFKDLSELSKILIYGGAFEGNGHRLASIAVLLICSVLAVFAYCLQKVLTFPKLFYRVELSNDVNSGQLSIEKYNWFTRIALIAGFTAVSIFIRLFDVAGQGFDVNGIKLIAYNFSRIAFAAYIIYFFICLGAFATDRIGKGSELTLEPVGQIILNFFLGSTLLAVILLLTGFGGKLSLELSFLLVTLIILAPHHPSSVMRNMSIHGLRLWMLATPKRSAIPITMLWLIMILLVVMVVVARVIFPLTQDADVWEHYLHYYRKVADSGSIAPNNVWYHFFISKGASLFFAGTQAIDLLAAPLISAAFIGAASLAMFDLMRRHLDITWAVAGVALFMAYLYGDIGSGLLYKHHGVFLSYVIFFMWCLTEYRSLAGATKSTMLVAAVFSSIYIGFYQPVPMAILTAGILLVGFASAAAKETDTQRLSLYMVAGSTTGIFAVLVVNYVTTGMIEHVPIRLFWRLANLERASTIVSETGVNYFLLQNNDSHEVVSMRDWITRAMRWNFLALLLPLYLLIPTVAAVGLTLVRRSLEFWQSARIAVICLCFLLPAATFAALIQIDSVVRLFQFIMPINILLFLVLLRMGTQVFMDSWGRGALVLPLLVILVSVGLLRGIESVGKQWSSFLPYSLGISSLKRTVNQSLAYSGLSLSGASALARLVGPRDRTFVLTYDSNRFLYSLPGNGLMSEPSYGIGLGVHALFELPAESIRAHLESQNINFFLLNLQAPLFSSLAFTRLFAAQDLSKNFRVVHEDANIYILTWRDAEYKQEFSPRLIRILEHKQSGNLHGLSSIQFEHKFAAILADAKPESFHNLHDIKSLVSENIIRIAATAVDPNLKKIMLQLEREIATSLPLEPSNQLPLWANSLDNMSEKKLAERWLGLVRLELKRRYLNEFGPKIGGLLAQCDERYPFAPEYQLNTNNTSRINQQQTLCSVVN